MIFKKGTKNTLTTRFRLEEFIRITCLKIAKNVEFYKKGDYMIRRDKYLQQLIQNRNLCLKLMHIMWII